MARRLIGWLVAMAYSAGGARRSVLRRLCAGASLPVVVHALSAPKLEALLCWLHRHGVIDRLWLSFDDGWATVADCIPVLEKFNVPTKIFIAPGQTLRGNVWTDEARQLGIPDPTWREWYPLPESERNKKLSFFSAQSTCSARLLKKEEIVALSSHPLISVENHTWSHLSATHRPVEEVVDEVTRAQKTLTEWTGRAPEWLAWPFGRGTPELDARMAELGLRTVYTRQGYEIGQCRNMAIEGVSFQENLGRILAAWPKVGETL